MSEFITVTGADEHTDLSALADLDCEVGLLYSATPDGRNRYPSKEWIIKASKTLPVCAIHICGTQARAMLIAGQLQSLVQFALRIQVNGRVEEETLLSVCAQFPHQTIITQYVEGRGSALSAPASNHALLVDASGGRGVSPAGWQRPATDKCVGFAGGLGANNLTVELSRIRAVASGAWWVDMEGKLRTRDDWFSIDEARKCVESFHGFLNPPL